MDNVKKNDFQAGVDCLVEANKRYWGNDLETVSGKGWIYVLHAVHYAFTPSVLEDIVAKGVQEQNHLPIVSVISGKVNELMYLTDRVDESFGIEDRFHPSYYDYNNEDIERLAEKMASETYGSKKGLTELTYRGIKFGDAVYDDILRRGNNKKRGDVFDCFDVSQERYRVFIRNALAIIDQAYAMFDERKPRYLITTEYFYTKGLYAHVACALGAKILVASAYFPDIVVQVDPNRSQLWEIKVADTTRALMRTFLQKYQSAANSSNLFLIEQDKSEIQIPAHWKGKKTVFILPHAYGDAPRESCRHNIYFDYSEWFIDTLRIIKNIPGVNWVIKDHPLSMYYGQVEYVRSIFENNRAENIYWIDKEYSGMNIKDFADCVITCTGDAGIEYWAYGIPTITAGDAYYCKWGISYQMKTLAEYENTLKDIANIKKPSKESSKLAQKALEAYKNWNKQSDCLSQLLYKSRLEHERVWKDTGLPYGKNDSVDLQLGKIARDFCEAFAEFLQMNDLKASKVYRLENLVEP